MEQGAPLWGPKAAEKLFNRFPLIINDVPPPPLPPPVIINIPGGQKIIYY